MAYEETECPGVHHKVMNTALSVLARLKNLEETIVAKRTLKTKSVSAKREISR